MRDSDVYRAAAVRMEGDGCYSPYSCDNIYQVLEGRPDRAARLCKKYERLFGNAEWWNMRGDGKFGHTVNRNYRGQRILALCFMAAISDSLHR